MPLLVSSQLKNFYTQPTCAKDRYFTLPTLSGSLCDFIFDLLCFVILSNCSFSIGDRENQQHSGRVHHFYSYIGCQGQIVLPINSSMSNSDYSFVSFSLNVSCIFIHITHTHVFFQLVSQQR